MCNKYRFIPRNGKSYTVETVQNLPRALSEFCKRHGLVMERDIVGIKVLEYQPQKGGENCKDENNWYGGEPLSFLSFESKNLNRKE